MMPISHKNVDNATSLPENSYIIAKHTEYQYLKYSWILLIADWNFGNKGGITSLAYCFAIFLRL